MDREPSPSSFPDVTGVMLAGGQSRRMGRDKAALSVAGQTMADRVLAFLQSLFPRTLIAGDRPDLIRPGIECFPDRYPGSSLGGLYNGLSNADSEWIFALPCDMPFPNPTLATALLTRRTAVAAVVPRSAAGFEPLFALYHKDCLVHLEAMLQQGNFRIYDFFQRIPVHYLDPAQYIDDWQRSLSNINTQADLERITRNSDF